MGPLFFNCASRKHMTQTCAHPNPPQRNDWWLVLEAAASFFKKATGRSSSEWFLIYIYRYSLIWLKNSPERNEQKYIPPKIPDTGKLSCLYCKICTSLHPLQDTKLLPAWSPFQRKTDEFWVLLFDYVQISHVGNHTQVALFGKCLKDEKIKTGRSFW